MRITVLYRPSSEHARRVEEYITDFERFHPGLSLDIHNADSVNGAQNISLYGIVELPTILALKDDGQMLQMWQGVDSLPLMNDLAYYARQ